MSDITIKPEFSNKLLPNETYEVISSEPLVNNSNIIIDLSLLTYSGSAVSGTGVLGEEYIKPIFVKINWDDDKEELKYNYFYKKDSGGWIYANEDMKHYLDTDKESISIKVYIYSNIGTVYNLIIKRSVIKQSFYDLGIELDVEKAIFTGDNSTVIFSIKQINENNSNTILSSVNSPIISVLN